MSRTKGGSGPSGLDSNGWKRMLLSSSFGERSNDVCKAIAMVARKICTEHNHHISLQAFLACKLIPLDKNPGLRPIGVGEILRRLIGKAVVAVTRDRITQSVGSLQVCAGQEAGCEAAMHVMRDVFNEEGTEAILMIDASNAFNLVSREVFLHNVKIVCPDITTFASNCYSCPARLFVIGGVELLSMEGTTKGDPIAMPVNAIAIIPLLMMLLEITDSLTNKHITSEAYANVFTAGGPLDNFKIWWNSLCRLGPLFGYHLEETKCWLVVNQNSSIKLHTCLRILKFVSHQKGGNI